MILKGFGNYAFCFFIGNLLFIPPQKGLRPNMRTRLYQSNYSHCFHKKASILQIAKLNAL